MNSAFHRDFHGVGEDTLATNRKHDKPRHAGVDSRAMIGGEYLPEEHAFFPPWALLALFLTGCAAIPSPIPNLPRQSKRLPLWLPSGSPEKLSVRFRVPPHLGGCGVAWQNAPGQPGREPQAEMRRKTRSDTPGLEVAT